MKYPTNIPKDYNPIMQASKQGILKLEDYLSEKGLGKE